MLGNQVPDKVLLKTINKRLVRINAPTKVMAEVSSGTVTMTGQLKYENERRQILKAVRATAGVQFVIDHLLSPPKRKPEQH